MEEKNTFFYVGVDIGGTNIATALVRPDGHVVARKRSRTPVGGSGEDTLAVIIETIEALLDKGKVGPKDLLAIGMGVAGPVDPDAGKVVVTPNMNLSGLAIAPPVEKHFGVPAVLGNDVNVGTLGEQWLGAARGADSAVGIFVGTGIGGGVIVGGRLVVGARLAGGEIGHIFMQKDGPVCGCGNHGCFEAIASRTAIERDIRAAVEAGRETALTQILEGDFSRIRSGALKKAIEMKDSLTVEILTRAAEYIGYACLTVRHLLDPAVIVLGGGVMEAVGDFMMPVIEKILADGSLSAARETAKVVLSELGDDAGVLGAVALAMAHIGQCAEAPAPETAPEYPQLAAGEFGTIRIDDSECTCDVVIRANGKVRKRKKSIAKETEGDAHRIGPDELKKVIKGKPEVLIIGTGYDGNIELTADAEALLAERGIRVEVLSTPEAIEAFNRETARKAALIHVTC